MLKLHHPGSDPDELDLQDEALLHIAAQPGAPPAPRPLRALDDRVRCPRDTRDGVRTARLLTWLEGRPWRDAGPHDEAQMAGLGGHVASVDRALAGFSHQAMDRDLLWNLTAAPRVAEWSSLVEPRKRPSVVTVLERYEAVVAPRLAALPHQVIHNDANELNVLVDGQGGVSGLIDYGDVVRSPRVCGLAVAAAYAMQGQDDPVRAVAAVIQGYDRVTPLTPAELEVVFELARTRLAVSVCMAAKQRAEDPENAYLVTSQDGVWDVLARVVDASPDLAHFRFRDRCGYEGNPAARRVRQHLASGLAVSASVLDADVATAHAVALDLHAEPFHPLNPAELAATARTIAERIRRAGAAFAIGAYGEDRAIYTGPRFRTADGRRRSLHLGVDLFTDAGTAIRAPLAGVVHATATNADPLDYGGVVVLEHATPDGVPFWTLLGHLGPSSIVHAVGERVDAGETVGTLGEAHENGGWPPHLHLQLLSSLVDAGTDVPGVAPPDEADLWRSVSPDPNLLLRRPDGVAVRPARSVPELVHRRATNFSRAMSLAYDEPLHIVAGRGAHLYDDEGRSWLDLVNNVCHVGHCHPRVVAAGRRQMARLNTNTRYLHEAVVTYGRRLVETLPDPLRVVFFVNSGSEANDLALRLATTRTGRRDVLVLDHAYHGHLSSQVALSPYKFDGRGGTGRPPLTHVCALPDPYRGAWRDAGATAAAYAADVCARLADLEHGPAAFFAESISGCGGQVVYPDGYLGEAFAAVRAAGGICVADEVQVGFGRVGRHFWGFELQGVVPDVVTMGKPMGNGHPIAAVVTTPEIAASFVTGMEYFNTFGGNPVSAEIGLAVLDVVQDEGLQARAAALGGDLIVGLRTLRERHPLVGDVRGEGLFLGVELSLDGDRRAPATAQARAVKEAMKARGVLVSTDGPDDNVLKIKPPMVLDRDDCDLVLEVLDRALVEVAAGS